MRDLFAAERIALICALAALLLVTGACKRADGGKADVIVLHTGRLCGNVYPLELRGVAPLQYYPYLAGYVKRVREEAAVSGARVLLVDLGDSLTGSFASHVTDSDNMVTFFNAMGYDAIFLSNLDSTVGPPILGKLKAKVFCPFQGPDGKRATPGTEFGGALEVAGQRVFLLANFYGDMPVESHPERFPDSFGSVVSGVKPLRDYTSVVRAWTRPPGSLTLFSWMKFEAATDRPKEFLHQLDELRVDAILAHRIYSSKQRDVWASGGFIDWRPPVSENILRNNGGFALARVDLKKDGSGWKVIGHELIPMTANAAPVDPVVAERIAAFAPAIRAADQPVATLSAGIGQPQILESYMVALSRVPGTDAVVYSPQSIRSDWPAGELRAGVVFNSLPWTSAIVQIPVSAEVMGRLCGETKFKVLSKSAAAGGATVLTTSRFFLSIIAREYGLDPASAKDAGQPGEFDYYVASLRADPGLLSGTPDAGWAFQETSR